MTQRIVKGAVRRVARRGALELLAVGQSLGLNRKGAHNVRFFYLHWLSESELPAFRWFLSEIGKRYRLVSYAEAVRRLGLPAAGEPVACVSFDDGFAGNLLAARELEAVGTTGAFFVCPGLLHLTRAELLPHFGPSLGSETRTLTTPEVTGLAERGHLIGNHTYNHRTLSHLKDEEAMTEITAARDWILQVVGYQDDGLHFAWPRGRRAHFTPSLLDLVWDSRHISCASANRGAHVGREDRPSGPIIRRENIDLRWPRHHIRYFIDSVRVPAEDWAWESVA